MYYTYIMILFLIFYKTFYFRNDIYTVFYIHIL